MKTLKLKNTTIVSKNSMNGFKGIRHRKTLSELEANQWEDIPAEAEKKEWEYIFKGIGDTWDMTRRSNVHGPPMP